MKLASMVLSSLTNHAKPIYTPLMLAAHGIIPIGIERNKEIYRRKQIGYRRIKLDLTY